MPSPYPTYIIVCPQHYYINFANLSRILIHFRHTFTTIIIAKRRYLNRIGTIFYQFDPCEEPEDIWENTLTYNNTLRDAEEEQYIRTMAKHTPNFEKEAWKYLGLEILGVEEFNWKNDNINPNSVYERLHCNDTRPSGRS